MITVLLSLRVTAAQIGPYPQLNSDKCGVSRLSYGKAINECLEWHKQYGTDQIRDGRNVTAGEAPWMAFISTKLDIKNMYL